MSCRGSAAAAARTRGCSPTCRWRPSRRSIAARRRVRRRRALDVEPRGGAPVLAGAIRRAKRERREAAPLGAVPADRHRRLDRPLHPAFLRACARQNLLEQPLPDSTASAIVHDLTAGLIDRHDRRSLGYNVEQTVRVASAVRDRLSTDNWRVLNRLLQLFTRETHAPDLDDALELIDERAVLPCGRRRARDGPHEPRRRLAVSESGASPRAATFRIAARSSDVAPDRRQPDRVCSNGCSSCPTAC